MAPRGQKMRLPYDTRLGVHPQNDQFTTHERCDFNATSSDVYPLLLGHTYFDLYRKQVVKQVDRSWLCSSEETLSPSRRNAATSSTTRLRPCATPRSPHVCRR